MPGLPRVSEEVGLAALATTLAILPVFFAFSQTTFPVAALFLAGWPALGLVAAVLLDRDRVSRVGWTLLCMSVVPAALLLGGALLSDGWSWDGLAAVAQRADVLLVLLMLIAVAWSVGSAHGRTSRRRLVWLLSWSGLLLAGVVVTSVVSSQQALAVVTALGIWAFAGLVLRLVSTPEFRPVDEPLLDAAVVLSALLIGAAAATAVRVGGLRGNVPFLEMSVVFTAVVTAAFAWPAGLWIRRTYLARRYGRGELTRADVASLTAGLNPQSDPRELLGKAAAMIQAATGLDDVQLIVGGDDVDPPAQWFAYRLDVGNDLVGRLLVRSRSPEGPELHQERTLRRMLPTVALMTRAVDLAVIAEQSRQDVARQREHERARILGELHDQVGPELAGMSMQVQAELRRNPSPLLRSLASGLATARGDLRRIVSGLTPSAFDEADVAAALIKLVDSFDTADGQVLLETHLSPPLPTEVSVAVYRCVAEGVVNALRHGRARSVSVRVVGSPTGIVQIDIRDDGIGGVIVPGVGLTAMRRRAESLGGSMVISPQRPMGTHLHIELAGGSTS